MKIVLRAVLERYELTPASDKPETDRPPEHHLQPGAGGDGAIDGALQDAVGEDREALAATA